MPKWLLFELVAARRFPAAAVAYFNSDRVVNPAVLALAGACMSLAAAGHPAGRGK